MNRPATGKNQSPEIRRGIIPGSRSGVTRSGLGSSSIPVLLIPIRRGNHLEHVPAAAVRNTRTAAAASPNERLLLTQGRGLQHRDQRARRARYPTKGGLSRLFQLVSRDFQLVAIRIAKVNRIRDAMILKVKSDSALFQFLLRSFKILSVRAQGKMKDTSRVALT